MPLSRNGKTYKFGPFCLDTSECLLLHGGERVALEPQVYRTLLVLVENSQKLSRKEWLIEQVWGQTHVEEGGLTRNIYVLRKVLGKGCIDTVPKLGYRFVADTAELTLGTESRDAYQAYIAGRYHLSQRSEAGLRAATEDFARAIATDPIYARAYSGLADSYTALGYLSYLAPREAFVKAKEAALTAVRLDASLSEPHTSLGYIHLYHDWQFAEAEAELKRAIALNPGNPTAHHWYAVYLTAMGRFDHARDAMERALDLDPTSLIVNTDLGFVCYYSGQYDVAIKQLQMVTRLNPQFALAHLWLGRAYQELARLGDAMAEFRQAESVLRGWSVVIAALGFVQGAAGLRDEARATLKALTGLATERYVTPYGIALVHAGLGETERALDWLDRALEDRSHWLVWLTLDPRLRGVRSHRRYRELVAKIGLADVVVAPAAR
jgi:DNA-binding winged helix-turn-helix (wHTH) protein